MSKKRSQKSNLIKTKLIKLARLVKLPQWTKKKKRKGKKPKRFKKLLEFKKRADRQVYKVFDRLTFIPAGLRIKLAKYWLPLAGFFLLFLPTFTYIFKDLPLPTRLTSFTFPASTLIFDHQGQLLYEIYAEKNRVPVELANLPEHIKWATVASEDKDFYQHHGLAFRGILRAAYNTVFRQSLQGGSTITQQLVKNALLTPERTVKRKIREAVLTIATEIIYSKDQILEMYLNQVPYGGTAWGIEAAAKTYFDKSAQELNLAEAALLAGLPISPTRFSPFGARPELAKGRQERVLQAMLEEDYITQEEYEQAKNDPLQFAQPANGIKAPHFVLWVKELLVEKFGERMVEQGGLKVTTTLDLAIQDLAQDAVATQVAKLEKRKVTNGAAMVTNPKTGEILAMVGSHDYFDLENDGNVNVTLRPRQPGSSIKPLNYALAFEKKILTPASLINDIPTCFSVTGQPSYCPVNYDGSYRGPIQTRFALGNSVNITAVKVLALNGVEDFINKAREMGITTWGDPSNYGLSLTLGGGEVKMYDMATAFGSLANLGIRQDLYAIEKVEELSGEVLYQRQETEGPRALAMEVAFLITHILLDNNARAGAFGGSSHLVVPNHPEVAVKTGTTNDYRDAWTIGYTPSRLVAVWVGNNDNSQMAYGTAGSVGATPAWNQIMRNALGKKAEEKEKDGINQEWHLKPEGIVGAHVCALSGRAPNPAEPCNTRFEYFYEGTVPAEIENLRQFIEMDKTTGQAADFRTPPENKEMQEHLVLYDILNVPYCLDCSVATPSSALRYPLTSAPANQSQSME